MKCSEWPGQMVCGKLTRVAKGLLIFFTKYWFKMVLLLGRKLIILNSKIDRLLLFSKKDLVLHFLWPWILFLKDLRYQGQRNQTLCVKVFSVSYQIKKIYRVCHRFRLKSEMIIFWVNFDHYWIKQYFLRQLVQYWKLAQA